MEEPSKSQPNIPIKPSDLYSAPFHDSQLAENQEGTSLLAFDPTVQAIQLNQDHGIPVRTEPSIIIIPQEQPPLNYSNLKPILTSEEYIVMQAVGGRTHAATAYNYSSNVESRMLLPRDCSAAHYRNGTPMSVPPRQVVVFTDHGDGFIHERSNLVQPQVIPSPPALQDKFDSSSEQLIHLNIAPQSSSHGQSLNHQQNIQVNSDTSMEPAALTNNSPQPHDESSAKPVQEMITVTPFVNATPPQEATIKQARHHHLLANKAANLANLLPTGTVLLFQSLIPSLSNSGKCQLVNKAFVGITILICALTCFLSSFTDSFYVEITEANLKKLYYGFATPSGLLIFNYDNREEEEQLIRKYLEVYKIRRRDYVHAFGSLIVFLVFAISSTEVVSCYFPDAGESELAVIVYLPLVAGVLATGLFSISPTKRKGIGYSDSTVNRVSE